MKGFGMSRITLFIRLSFRYWKMHFKRIVTLAAVCILGAAALCFSCLYIRSEKSIVMEQELDMFGDYDAVVYGIEEEDIPLAADDEAVSAYGFYRELGYVGIPGGTQYKAAAFPDEGSARMYHMTCSQGRYPQNEGEIAIDEAVAKNMGIVPVAGQNVTLKLYDMERRELTDREYVLTGIFQASSASSFGGFYRYPNTSAKGMEGYEVPVVFLADGEKSLFDSSLVTLFVQTETEASQFSARMQSGDSHFKKILGCDIPTGRMGAYSYILGFAGHFLQNGELTVSGIKQALSEGNVWKDFYSAVLIPLFAAFILVIVTVSVFSLVWDIVMGRAREIAILRSIGMTKAGTFLYLFAELAVMSCVFILAGMGIGSASHYLLVRIMNASGNADVPLGFRVSPYVASVTPNPWIYAAAIIGAAGAVAALVPLFKMSASTPIKVFKMDLGKGRRKSGRHFNDFSNRTWRAVISRHIRFYDRAALVIMCIVMSAAFFGYNYFRAFSEKENGEYESELAQNGLADWDFYAHKGSESGVYDFLIENRHDCGIDKSAYDGFADCGLVDSSFARIVNKSTRVSYPGGSVPEAAEAMLRPFSMRRYAQLASSEDDYEHAEYEAEDAMLSQIGYRSDEDVYSLPTIGLLPDELAALSGYVEEGEINPEKINDGEEALLVVPAEIGQSALQGFDAGDALPLSDIVLSEEEDGYQFNTFNPFDYAKPAYMAYVKDPSAGAAVRYASFAFGKRKDIPVKIGAIAVLDDESLCAKYLLPCEDLGGYGDNAASAYAPCLLCTCDTFASWGLPDRLFTEARFAVSDNDKLEEANEAFYSMIGESNGIAYSSSFEIRERMDESSRNTMTIYYTLVAALVCLGMLTVGIKFYSRVKFQSRTIAKLRAIGMSLAQAESLVMRQNFMYPLIGAAVSLIPVGLCQMLFSFITKQIDSGVWDGGMVITSGGGGLPWYHGLPFRYNLFSYHPLAVLLVIILVFEILMLAATIPQIKYVRNQSIAEMMDADLY